MTLQDQIAQNIKQAMLNKQAERLEILRYLSAQVTNAQINKGRANLLTDSEVESIIRKIIKNSQEAIAQYQQAGRTDLQEKEAAQVTILQEFLPQPLTESELRELVGQIKNANPDLARGPLTGKVMAEVNGRASGSNVSKIIGELLA